MRTLGVDLAARPVGTACCTLRWDETTARVEELVGAGATDDDLLERMAGADRVGIDCPLGWPTGFVRAIDTWSVRGRWEPPPRPEELTLRVTDRHVAARVRHPLSVSADKIAVVAFRCAGLLDRFARRRGAAAVDRSGTSGTVAEVYPAAALVRWSWFEPGGSDRAGVPVSPVRRASYKRAGGREVRGTLVGAMAARLPWLELAGHEDELVRSDDALDALVAALVARAVARGLTEGPGPADLEAARREGWIHVPLAGSLDRLVG